MDNTLALQSDYFDQGLVSRTLRVLPIPEPEFEAQPPPYMLSLANSPSLRRIATQQAQDREDHWNEFHRMADEIFSFWCAGFAGSEPASLLELINDAHTALVSHSFLFSVDFADLSSLASSYPF